MRVLLLLDGLLKHEGGNLQKSNPPNHRITEAALEFFNHCIQEDKFMNVCFSSPTAPTTRKSITQMLANSPDDDACLLLAYGYLGSSPEMRAAIAAWFQKRSNRKICLVVGLLEERKSNAYLNEKNGEDTLGPYPGSPVVVRDKIETYIKYYFGLIGHQLQLDNNFFVYVVPGYHGKVCALLGEGDDPDKPFIWSPLEAILGSSNLSAALSEHFEIDVHLQRSSGPINKFAAGAPAFFESLTKQTEMSGTVANRVTEQVRSSVIELNHRRKKWELDELEEKYLLDREAADKEMFEKDAQE